MLHRSSALWRRLLSSRRATTASCAPIVSAAALAGVAGSVLATSDSDASTVYCEAVAFDASQFPTPSYAGEVVIVTGGSTGIGKATCDRLADAGAIVYNLDVARPIDPKAAHIHCDVRRVKDVRRTIDKIASMHGRIDVLVSNAGVWAGGPLEDVSEAEYERVLGINVKGTFFAVQSVVPYMRKQRSGAIVLIGSDQSLVGKPEQNLYGMTKGAIVQLSKSCAAQYAPEGVRVNCVCPGTIDTPLMRGAIDIFANNKPNLNKDDLLAWLQTAQPYPRVGQPDEVAAVIAAIAKIPFVVGAVVSVDGGYTCQ